MFRYSIRAFGQVIRIIDIGEYIGLRPEYSDCKWPPAAWQGVYLCEHTNNGGSRHLVVMNQGEQTMEKHMPPDALLFISPGCPHCPGVLQALSELVKDSLIGKMTVVNVAVHPELAEEHGVRAAPWLRLGPFTFTGAYSLAELRLWAERAGSADGAAHYVEYLLKQGGYKQAVLFIAEDIRRLKPLLGIIANPAANLEVRLGASALLESFAGKEALQNLLPELADLTRHEDYRVRADACHLLGLTGSDKASTHVELCLRDAHEEVREIAQEAMEKLRESALIKGE